MTKSSERKAARSSGPLQGIRVVELGQLIAGPFCGQLLGDYGAEVIKIEDPLRGDPMRRWGYSDGEQDPVHWAVLGRNKRSLTCDLRTAEGQAVVRRLIASADILVENFRPGTMEKWGLDYGSLSAENPGLVMVRVTGFGQEGPYSHRPGYGSIGEAMGGLRNLLGEPDRPPSRAGVSLGDSLAGTLGALGAVSAIVERSQSGRGQVIDCALFEAVLAMMESLVSDYETFGHVRERSGALLPGIAPSNVYPTRDGVDVLIAANQDTVYRRLCAAMGREELVDDERFASHSARGEHQSTLDAIIAEWSENLSLVELQQRLEEHAVPIGQIYRASDMLVDPHFKARESIVSVDANGRPLSMQGVFPRFSRTPGAVRWSGPQLGQSTDDVLNELGIGEEERSRLRKQGVIA